MNRRSFILAVIPPVCTSVFAQERRCRICGVLIGDNEKYYQVKGSRDVYCERCYLEAPRCSVCKLPTAASEVDPDTGACPRCLAKLPRCRACGKPIVGTAYRYRYSKAVFCADCKNNRPACAICGVPVGDDYWKYPDGRIICGDCGGRAVFDLDQIKRVMADAAETVEKRLGLKLKNQYTVTVETLSGLDSPRRQDSASSTALYGSELGKYRLTGGRSEVFLLFGLPPELLYETAAHEYAHAWQAENGLLGSDAELVEGFAQWVAADVLRTKGYRSALEKLEARTDYPYGTGYQKLRILHQRMVMDAILQKRP